MRRGVTVVFFMSLLLSCFPASGRAGTGPADRAADERVIRAILFLTGAPDIESLSEEELEKWWDLAESPGSLTHIFLNYFTREASRLFFLSN